jgi:hypothetical protein
MFCNFEFSNLIQLNSMQHQQKKLSIFQQKNLFKIITKCNKVCFNWFSAWRFGDEEVVEAVHRLLLVRHHHRVTAGPSNGPGNRLGLFVVN